MFSEDPDLLGADAQPEAAFPRLLRDLVSRDWNHGEKNAAEATWTSVGLVVLFHDLSLLLRLHSRSGGSLEGSPGSQELDDRVNRAWIQELSIDGSQTAKQP